jgi:hypothetical protein
VIIQNFALLSDLFRFCTGKNIRTCIDSLGPFCVITKGYTQDRKDTALFLDPPGIGKDEHDDRFQDKKLKVTDRIHDPEAVLINACCQTLQERRKLKSAPGNVNTISTNEIRNV